MGRFRLYRKYLGGHELYSFPIPVENPEKKPEILGREAIRKKFRPGSRLENGYPSEATIFLKKGENGFWRCRNLSEGNSVSTTKHGSLGILGKD
jgi:hypothetical protein